MASFVNTFAPELDPLAEKEKAVEFHLQEKRGPVSPHRATSPGHRVREADLQGFAVLGKTAANHTEMLGMETQPTFSNDSKNIENLESENLTWQLKFDSMETHF